MFVRREWGRELRLLEVAERQTLLQVVFTEEPSPPQTPAAGSSSSSSEEEEAEEAGGPNGGAAADAAKPHSSVSSAAVRYRAEKAAGLRLHESMRIASLVACDDGLLALYVEYDDEDEGEGEDEDGGDGGNEEQAAGRLLGSLVQLLDREEQRRLWDDPGGYTEAENDDEAGEGGCGAHRHFRHRHARAAARGPRRRTHTARK
jgi:hypothetical protein